MRDSRKGHSTAKHASNEISLDDLLASKSRKSTGADTAMRSSGNSYSPSKNLGRRPAMAAPSKTSSEKKTDRSAKPAKNSSKRDLD